MAEVTIQDGLAEIKHIIGVASGKGGVGKSTTAVNLALALAANGAKVGILDADIYGPSVPMMLGLPDGTRPQVEEEKYFLPVPAHGIVSMSMGYLVTEQTPMVWRGPMATGALMQMLNQTRWGALDYLVVDMPPAESTELHRRLAEADIDTIYLVAPTTSADRAKDIAEACTGYLYYVSLKGVTGAAITDHEAIRESIESMRQLTDLPVVVGFGVSTAEHVQALSKLADGVVVGSAIVKCVADGLGDENAILQALHNKVSALTQNSVLLRA